MLDAIVERALRLSKSTTATLGLRDGDVARVVARIGSQALVERGDFVTLDQRRVSARAIVEARTFHIPDHSAPAVLDEFPDNHNRNPVAAAGATRA